MLYDLINPSFQPISMQGLNHPVYKVKENLPAIEHGGKYNSWFYVKPFFPFKPTLTTAFNHGKEVWEYG
jgi:hypothetical protein